MNTDVHAVLDGFADNAGLQDEVNNASIPELEAWVPTVVEALRGRDSDPARLAVNMNALFSALAARDLFVAALLLRLNEVVPDDRKVVLGRALSKFPEYQQVVRDLQAAIERGDIVRTIDETTHAVTFQRRAV